MKAREVFRDCEYAKECLQQAIEQNRLKDAKLFWFAALAMLRAIGHVLDKVDADERGSNFRDTLQERYKLWKQDPIFANFIERERNNILKEYVSSLTERATTDESFLVTESGERLVTESGSALVGTTTISTLVKGNGVYSGISPDDVLARALAWWNRELSELELISE
jgi:hypothetical protein